MRKKLIPTIGAIFGGKKATNVSNDSENTSEPSNNPILPPELANFKEVKNVNEGTRLTADEWLYGLHEVEIKDIKQQIWIRPLFAGAVFLLLVGQNVGIGFFVYVALEKSQLPQLQLIFSTLVAATLTQSYFILRLITKKIFGNIDYHYEGLSKGD